MSDGMRDGWDAKRSDAGCERRRYSFPNGYGASVIRGAITGGDWIDQSIARTANALKGFGGACETYGASQGLWELAVLNDDDGALLYAAA